jgi:Putative Ig domain
MSIAILPLLTLLLGAGPPGEPGVEPSPATAMIQDIFGRPIDRHGLVLVDWEGQIANPAIRIDLVPPPDAAYPVRFLIRAKEPRLYFDLPSSSGPSGPRKEVLFKHPERSSMAVSIFPDRDGRDEDHTLEVEVKFADGKRRSLELPVHVVDQDRERPPAFAIAVDFSQDRTGFFKDEARRRAVIRVAEDWAYFLDGDGLEPVRAGAETTMIWNADGFKSTRRVRNDRDYTGYLIYAYGIDGPSERSGGEASTAGGFQHRAGKALTIRRSGGYEAEIKGNYNTRGWRVDLGDADWWRATNLRQVPCDLESIAHHEMGHALIFHPANVQWGVAKLFGRLRDDRLRAYLGSEPKIDGSDHLPGTIDPASLRGAFGNEYHGKTPYGRWLITKTDLLCAQAVGHRLRETSAFAPVTLQTETLPDGSAAAPYSARLIATGGIPFYHFEITDGSLPAGLSLDAFTGELRGTPERPGTSEFTVRVRDYDERAAGASRKLRIRIAGG